MIYLLSLFARRPVRRHRGPERGKWHRRQWQDPAHLGANQSEHAPSCAPFCCVWCSRNVRGTSHEPAGGRTVPKYRGDDPIAGGHARCRCDCRSGFDRQRRDRNDRNEFVRGPSARRTLDLRALRRAQYASSRRASPRRPRRKLDFGQGVYARAPPSSNASAAAVRTPALVSSAASRSRISLTPASTCLASP